MKKIFFKKEFSDVKCTAYVASAILFIPCVKEALFQLLCIAKSAALFSVRSSEKVSKYTGYSQAKLMQNTIEVPFGGNTVLSQKLYVSVTGHYMNRNGCLDALDSHPYVTVKVSHVDYVVNLEVPTHAALRVLATELTLSLTLSLSRSPLLPSPQCGLCKIVDIPTSANLISAQGTTHAFLCV
jgi:uncharacterized protein YbbK (DUF523 family)